MAVARAIGSRPGSFLLHNWASAIPRLAGALLTMFLLLAVAGAARAGTERFDYDALGRLVRHVDPNGVVTEYEYDAVGNILAVRRGGTLGPPSVTEVAPAAVRRQEAAAVRITGSSLLGARVVPVGPALDLSALRASTSQVVITLTVGAGAVLGPQQFNLTTSYGTAAFQITVNPALPVLTTQPAIIIEGPGRDIEVVLRLSNADYLPHTLGLTSSNAAVAAISAGPLHFSVGQTEARFTVRTGAVGFARVEFASASLAAFALGVHVVAPLAGPNLRQAAAVGVVRPEATPATQVPQLAAAVGVMRSASPSPSPPATTLAPSVGVVREAPLGPAPLASSVLAPSVGVAREAPADSNGRVGTLLAPATGVKRDE